MSDIFYKPAEDHTGGKTLRPFASLLVPLRAVDAGQSDFFRFPSFVAITLSPSIPPTPLPDGGHAGQRLQNNECHRIEQPE
jgi:hypothetical protein